MKRFLLAVVLLLYAADAGAAQKLTLMLDWFPNVDHLPVYTAVQKGFFREAGLEVEILSPSETTDGLKLAAAGRVDLAVSYQPQAIIAAASGLPVRVVGRLVGHPLTTLLFLKDSGIRTPADLSGRPIGYTVPGLMDVLLAAFAKVNGVGDYQAVNVGFAIVQSLSAGRVDAVMGPFKTYETVEMAHRGLAVGYFELEKYGIPDYDELIFVCGAQTLEKRRAEVDAFIAAVARGIAAVRKHPAEALELYFKAVPDAERKTESEALALTLPYFAGHQRLDPERWQRFADFALVHGLIETPVDVGRLLAGP
ncbi:MAG TPA: ABC transporter substrate-binding protein [Desulfobacteraceae bacterium]|nr:ABC transporter substrate-binding protein [Deltaproteobacteria bacterium]MBW2357024.1 ABC transporter substrate-binding protein [Deltaproteobacteria bacterium]HDI60385.1 ABC transporter substrate-binding protein [Desulfobacteraceae bacterium]